jgi:hypothetical protein
VNNLRRRIWSCGTACVYREAERTNDPGIYGKCIIRMLYASRVYCSAVLRRRHPLQIFDVSPEPQFRFK